MGNEGKECGICLDEIKPKKSMKFGLLSSCNHLFCFECLKKWKEVKLDLVECPECRVFSELVMPNKRFLTGTKKNALIQKFKSNPSFQSQCLVNRRPYPIEKEQRRETWTLVEIARDIPLILFGYLFLFIGTVVLFTYAFPYVRNFVWSLGSKALFSEYYSRDHQDITFSYRGPSG